MVLQEALQNFIASSIRMGDLINACSCSGIMKQVMRGNKRFGEEICSQQEIEIGCFHNIRQLVPFYSRFYAFIIEDIDTECFTAGCTKYTPLQSELVMKFSFEQKMPRAFWTLSRSINEHVW